MKGTLYICATPIGNLEDLTFRALRILKEVNLIAAEDTRHTIKLLNHYNIKTPLTSYHKHNEKEKAEELVRILSEGKDIALVSDAGMPCIQDPGEHLVKLCHERGISVTSAPGATAFATALSLSGLSTEKFMFEGFLSTNKKERVETLTNLLKETKTIIFYSAPHHLKKDLEDMFKVLGNREVSLVKEITKKFENINKTSLSDAIDFYKENEVKGEFVIVLSGISKLEKIEQDKLLFSDISIFEHYTLKLKELNSDKKEAMKAVAKERKISKRQVFDEVVKNSDI